MKKNRRYLLLGISLILVFTLIVGCSARSSDSTSDYDRGEVVAPSAPEAMPMPQENVTDNKGVIGTTGDSSLKPKKVITTVSLSIETMEFESSNKELNKLIEKYDGYIENSNISYNSYRDSKMYRYGEYVVRIPSKDVVGFKTELNLIGNITNESTNKQDVTSQYTDTESRLKVVTVKEERILALLEKAEKIEDIIALENQLSQTIYEKESLKSSLLTLDDKVDFSTIHVNIQEVQKFTDAETVETTFGQKVANAIKNSLYSFSLTLQSFIIFLIYSFPFIIIIVVLLIIVIWILKRIRKNRIDK